VGRDGQQDPGVSEWEKGDDEPLASRPLMRGLTVMGNRVRFTGPA
jgi:hypothetical protein